MGDEIELISDGDGLAIVGNAAAVERFVASTSLVPSTDEACELRDRIGWKSSKRPHCCVHEFRELLGIESGRDEAEARRWGDAANEQWDKVRDTGSDTVSSVKRFGSGTLGQAKSVKGKLAGKITDRKLRRVDESSDS